MLTADSAPEHILGICSLLCFHVSAIYRTFLESAAASALFRCFCTVPSLGYFFRPPRDQEHTGHFLRLLLEVKNPDLGTWFPTPVKLSSRTLTGFNSSWKPSHAREREVWTCFYFYSKNWAAWECTAHPLWSPCFGCGRSLEQLRWKCGHLRELLKMRSEKCLFIGNTYKIPDF